MAKSTIMFSGFPTNDVVGIEIITEIKGSSFQGLTEADQQKWKDVFLDSLEKKKSVFPKKMFTQLRQQNTFPQVDLKLDVTQLELKQLRQSCLGTMGQENILDVASDEAWGSVGVDKAQNEGVRVTLNTSTNIFGSWLQPTFGDAVKDVAKIASDDVKEKLDDAYSYAEEKDKNALPFLKDLGISAGIATAIILFGVGIFAVIYVAR